MSRSKPAVSVLIAVYNGERFLPQAIDSVLGQTFADLELLIIDDGSTDGTPELLAEYAREDPRIVVHPIAHAGVSAALNVGCDHASGDLIARLDADDVALPNRIERQLLFLAEHEDVALLGGAAHLIDEQGRVFGESRPPTSEVEIRNELQGSCPFYNSTVVFRKNAALEVGGYRRGFEPSEDYELWLRLAEHNGIANLAEPLAQYRFSPQQASITKLEAQAVGLVAAKVAARDRRQGRPEQFATARQINGQLLVAAGVEWEELVKTEIRLAAWYAQKYAEAGRSDVASALWDKAIDRANAFSIPPAFLSKVRRSNTASHAGRPVTESG